MPDYGYYSIGAVGNSVQVIASDFANVRWKVGGVTIDWDTVTAVADDVTLPNGTVIKKGEKYIPAGTVLAKITASGKYGPADTTETDGRQALARGACYLLNEDVAQNPILSLVATGSSDHPGVFDGGTVWNDRLHVGGTNEPTLANLLAAMPLLEVIEM